MAQFDDITEAALGNFGLITAAQAAEMGVRSKDIAEWVRLGRLERRGWGVYRIAHYVPSDFDRYAEATALVGGDAAVWGESVAWAQDLERKLSHGARDLVFVIGGAYGFSQPVYDRANEKLSLSEMTFSHQLVRLVFVEQLYRAFTIMRGEPYHHE